MCSWCSTMPISTRRSRRAPPPASYNAGQACNAAKRFLVHEKIADRFLDKFTATFSNVKIGDPMDESTGMGPLCSVAARDNLAAQVERAVTAGATLHHGGKVIEGPGAFYQPTILTGITRDNPAYFEEFFGPVAQVYVVRDDDEVVELANDSNFGLSGAIFTADVERAKALASRIETGSVWINTRFVNLPRASVRRSEAIRLRPRALRARHQGIRQPEDGGRRCELSLDVPPRAWRRNMSNHRNSRCNRSGAPRRASSRRRRDAWRIGRFRRNACGTRKRRVG